MKTIGLIGGMSWFSTSVYYRTLNELVNERLEGSHSARIILYSIDYGEFVDRLAVNDWPGILALLSEVAQKLEGAGADCVMIGSVTPHLIADRVSESISIPLLHIADAVAKEIHALNIRQVALLGTRFTMEQPFFKDRLKAQGIETITPPTLDREFIHASIFNELTQGVFSHETKPGYIEIIHELQAQGAEGVIFGCTEIALLLPPDESPLPVFDTTTIHCKAAVEFALSR